MKLIAEYLERALQYGADPASAHYNLALVHLAKGERAAAQESVARALDQAPTHPQARQLRDRLISSPHPWRPTGR